jgi:hypothetical protein
MSASFSVIADFRLTIADGKIENPHPKIDERQSAIFHRRPLNPES